MNRFILGLFLVMLLTVLALVQGVTSELNSTASSTQATLGDESMASTEAADGQGAIDEAEEMDQLIQTISDSSSGAEEAAAVSGTADAPETDQSINAPENDNDRAEEVAAISGTADAPETDQSTNAPEDDSGSAAGVDEVSGTIEEAEEMDLLIQVLVEEEGSTNEGVEADQDAGTAGKEEATNQSVGIFIEDAGEVPAKAGQDSGALNQTQSMDQLIQTLVDSGNEGNNSSEIVQDVKSVNETGPAGQSIPVPADNAAAGAETAQQVGITEKTESMNLLIQTIVNNESLAGTKTAQSVETIEKTESVDQLIQTLADERDSAKGSDEVVSGQSLEIIDEEISMEGLIQALTLEGSDVQ